MKEITQVQQKYFDMFGFIIIRNVLSKSELKAIEEEYQLGFKKTLEHHSDGYGMRKQFNWSNLNEKCPNLCNLPSHPIILKEKIINKINSYFGYKLIDQIRLQTYNSKKKNE